MKINVKIIKGQITPHSNDDKEAVANLVDNAIYVLDFKQQNTRTLTQNRAMHKYFALVSESLNEKSLSIVKTLKVDIFWTPDSVKTLLWKEISRAVLGKKSTTKLNRNEIDKVYDTMNSALAIRFGISIPFPSQEK